MRFLVIRILERLERRYGFCGVEQQRALFPMLRSKAETV